jgi:hypothetical protein
MRPARQAKSCYRKVNKILIAGVAWIARSDRDRAHVHVAIVDVPTVRAFMIATSGEIGQSFLHVSPLRRELMQRCGRSLSCVFAFLTDQAAGKIMNASCRRSPQRAEVNIALRLAA